MSAVQVTINGVDRTTKLKNGSLKISNLLTNKRDICDFEISNYGSNSYVPVIGQEVIITLNSVKIFGGVITEIEHKTDGPVSVSLGITCQDYTRLLDKKLVSSSYEGQTVNAIIADLQTNYMPAGFTIANVNAPTVINYISFNYKQLSKCLDQLAELINYDWYVDYDKDIHFFSKDENIAPFDLNDDDGSYWAGSLVVRKDNSQMRNTIIVRGGEFAGAEFTAEIEASGTDTIFPLGYKFQDFEASLTGDPLSVGIDYINQPDDYDALHNYTEKILRFKDADKPSAGSIIRYSGKPVLPVIIKLQDTANILATMSAEGGDGVYEYLITDTTLNSKESARQRARAEIVTYATTLSEAEFVTENPGLVSGQKIRVNSPLLGIDEYYIINKVTFKQFTADSFVYQVSLVTTRTFDLISILQGLISNQSQDLTINENEVVDTVLGLQDEFAVSDSLGTFTSTEGPYVWAPASGGGTEMRWGFFTWG